MQRIELLKAKKELEVELKGVEGIVSVGASKGMIVVYVETEEDCAKVPKSYGGFAVRCVEVGRARFL